MIWMSLSSRRRTGVNAAHSDGNGKHDVSVDAKMAKSQEFITNTNSSELRQQQRRRSRENREREAESSEYGKEEQVAYTKKPRLEGVWEGLLRQRSWWATEPQLGRVANGVANQVDRLKAIGNGQVPAVAALAWNILSEGLI